MPNTIREVIDMPRKLARILLITALITAPILTAGLADAQPAPAPAAVVTPAHADWWFDHHCRQMHEWWHPRCQRDTGDMWHHDG
ncbi:hypothetical protein [Nocardia sp. NBC_00511]|uniref:hypothetical protein n=1 Tax=Nocardia sp. NBC_00511 TaxID=2903591 RepID=UPI0030DE73ED